MNYRKFGQTDLLISEVGFGAWGIGGPAMAGDIPIGWGKVDDGVSVAALRKAFDLGINFYDTADFYGLGHSETLIGKELGNRDDVIIASKVGHRLNNDGSIALDYSFSHIMNAAEQSLKRLNRDVIDYYQLHSARIEHLENGECIEAMEKLKEQGKIKYWGISLNTFSPKPEADFFMSNKIGSGFQLVLNMINQRTLEIMPEINNAGYGVIARMPLQFGLLTGKFNRNSKFEENDHRRFRLTPEMLDMQLDILEEIWNNEIFQGVNKTALALSFILSVPGVSTVIPGIKTPEQAAANCSGIDKLSDDQMNMIYDQFEKHFSPMIDKFV